MTCCGLGPRSGVLLDGEHHEVGSWACSWACFRAQLGVPLGTGVAIETTMGRALVLSPDEARTDLFGRLWDFVDGQRYYRITPEEAALAALEVTEITPLIEGEAEEDREPWQQDPDAWKG